VLPHLLPLKCNTALGALGVIEVADGASGLLEQHGRGWRGFPALQRKLHSPLVVTRYFLSNIAARLALGHEGKAVVAKVGDGAVLVAGFAVSGFHGWFVVVSCGVNERTNAQPAIYI
jgi:hypothetical protein